MSIINKTMSFIDNKDIKVILEKQVLKIINYIEISRFDNDIIIIKHNDGIIHINGQGLFIMKLLVREILVGGNIKSIEFR